MTKNDKYPKTVGEAVELLMEELSFGDRTIIANMKEKDLGDLDFALGKRIRFEFKLGNGNDELMQSCSFESGQQSINFDLALNFIIKKLWEKVQVTSVLKVIK